MRKVLAISTGEGLNGFVSVLNTYHKDVEVYSLDSRKKWADDRFLKVLAVEIAKGKYDFIFCNGLNTSRLVGYLKGLYLPVFGVCDGLATLESQRDKGKDLLKELGVPTPTYGSYKNYEDFLFDLDYAISNIGFPAFIKHIDGRSNLSYKVNNFYELQTLLRFVDYPKGFTLEKMVDGLEVSSNYLINNRGYRYIGSNYDVKDDIGNLLGNVYCFMPDIEILYLDKIKGLLNHLVEDGYTGVLAITFIINPDTLEVFVIDTNVRFGYTSETMYLDNIVDLDNVLSSVAHNKVIPEIRPRTKYGITVVVNSALKLKKLYSYSEVRYKGERLGNSIRLDNGYLIENKLHNGYTDGNEPFLIVQMGKNLESITSKIDEINEDISLPLKSCSIPQVDRLIKLQELIE